MSLSINNISFKVGTKQILNNISLTFNEGELHAIVGPSGCGKSTLLKSILKLNKYTGIINCSGLIGYVPQFSEFHETLTVNESLQYSIKLFKSSKFTNEWFKLICDTIGITPLLNTQIKHLSGGQLRRLSLAEALIPMPQFLLCDEVTSGLDHKAEIEVLQLLQSLIPLGITPICVIHNISILHLFDTITVLNKGEVSFNGSSSHVKNCNQDNLFEDLANISTYVVCRDIINETPLSSKTSNKSFLDQTKILLLRRLYLMCSDKGQLTLFTALTLGFPVIVVIFALGGLPDIDGLSSLNLTTNAVLISMQTELKTALSMISTGSLISGLIMFQVILLTLMGSNNGSREIVSEKTLTSKEFLLGLRKDSYLTSKLIFLFILSVIQGLWMTIFVKYICNLPGSVILQASTLTLVVFAMSLASLTISAYSSSSEKASLISTYLVGFQLPLSGVVLALPEVISAYVRPFIISFSGWSGYLETLKTSQLYDSVSQSITITQYPFIISLGILSLHIIVYIYLTFTSYNKV